jgi:methylated-DNA-[protein]-cysteine S-methyltransferase
MSAEGFSLFETVVGRCGIAWGARGIVGLQLPEGSSQRTRSRLQRRFPTATEAAPPPEVEGAVKAIASLLQGGAADLATVPLDMGAVPEFHRRVYATARSIPPGQTTSYGALAARLGAPGAARAVGQALGRNPFPIVVPCHRVLGANGKVGGFSAVGGVVTKLRLLSAERDAGGDRPPPYDGEAAVRTLRAADPALGRLIDRIGPFRLRLDATSSVFLALAEAIVYQQLTGRAAATIFARLQGLFPHAADGPTPEQLLRASDARLLGAGLSRAKLLALRDLARRTAAGELPALEQLHALDDEAIIEQLTRVRGIGRWTAEMLLIFRLGRPDVLPLDDFGVRKGLGLMLGRRALPTRAQLERRGARWAPHRTVASWYLWRAVSPET